MSEGRDAPDDDDTVISASTDDDPVLVISPNDDTVVSPPPGDDDSTLVSARRAPGRADDDETIANRTRRDDDRTRKVVRVAKGEPRDDGAGAPGLLTGGRVAFVPGKGIDRYSVRRLPAGDERPERLSVSAPVVATRQSADNAVLDGRTSRTRRRQGAGVLIAVLVATAGAIALVAATVAALAAS